MDRDNTQAALELAALGYRVVPIHTVDGEKCDCPNGVRCPSPAKHPRITDWPKNASADAVHVERWFKAWPHANVGIATGAASDLVVIDIDPRNGGYEELLRLYAEHGNPPAGPVAYTGGGGWHLYFKHPGGKVLSRSIAPGIDCKGDGGQVVAPPSFHASGNQYEWCETGLEYEKPELPDWLLLMVKADHDEGPSSYAKPVVGAIAEGKRRETLLSLAGTMRRRGFGQEGIFRALMAENDERCDPPLERTEVASIAASAARDWEPQEGIVVSSGKSPEGVLGKHGQKREVVEPFSARALQAMVLPDPRWAVPGLLPEGLSLLAGRPKLGKSWLSFNLGIAVAEGGIALGEWPVDDGDVLILALEDRPKRLQGRMRMMMGDQPWPERLYMANDWPRQNEGGLEAIEAWLGAHPNARLVVIDTLAKFKAPPVGGKRGDVYAEDYAVIEALQASALRHSVALVLITHYNKALHDDWINAVTSSSGTTGAADTILGLERPRGQGGQREAVLHVTGRDVEEHDYAVAFDGQAGTWTVTGAVEDVKVSKETAELVAVMMKIGHAVQPDEVAAAMGVTRPTAYKRLYRASLNGYIVSHGNKLYSLIKTENAAGSPENAEGDRYVSYLSEGDYGRLIRGHSDTKDSGQVGQQMTQQNQSRVIMYGRGQETGNRFHSTKSDSTLLSEPVRVPALCHECGTGVLTLRMGNRMMCEECRPAIVPIRKNGGEG